jgi:hypothetical protein
MTACRPRFANEGAKERQNCRGISGIDRHRRRQRRKRTDNGPQPGGPADAAAGSRRGDTMAAKGKSLAVLLAATFATGLLTGCEEEEQDRILLFEKGTYLGEPDEPMGGTSADELRQRAKNQGAL